MTLRFRPLARYLPCMKPTVFAVVGAMSVAAAFGQSKFGNNAAITPARLKAHLEFIASDEMEGRDTPSRGLDIATLYVATQLKLWGAIPAGDHGSYFQNVRLSRYSPSRDIGGEVEFGGTKFRTGKDYVGSSVNTEVSGRLVFVGHGMVVKSKGIDPYADVDVRGKIVIFKLGRPKGVSDADFGKERADAVDPFGNAARHGAVGAIILGDEQSYDKWAAPSTDPNAYAFGPNPATPQKQLPFVQPNRELANSIFVDEHLSAKQIVGSDDFLERGFDLASSKTLRFKLVDANEYRNARNVVAIVPGSDSKLKSEIVAFGAHIDHLGMDPSLAGDQIYNGADDDGSGTVSVLEIAHAILTGPRPKRSCLFVWHIGEEKGLWGSEYFTNHPTVDLKRVIAQLNIDMVGRSRPAGDKNPANSVLTGPNEIYAVGSTKMSTDLHRVSESVNRNFLQLKFNYKYDAPNDSEQIFYRSDHYNYAHKGIPIIFYFDGVHEDYHRVSDEVSKIDFLKMSRVVRTVYATGWTLANGAKRPRVDKPLKE